MACRQQLSRRLSQRVDAQGVVQLSQSSLIQAVEHRPAAAGNHRTVHHVEVLELAQLGAQRVDTHSGALNDFSAATLSVFERMDDRQSNGISEYQGGLGDEFRLTFGAHYGGHGVHLV